MPENDDKIRLRARDSEEGLRDWAKQEITSAAGYEVDLGKFFFGVSAGTLGAIVGLEKLSGGIGSQRVAFWYFSNCPSPNRTCHFHGIRLSS